MRLPPDLLYVLPPVTIFLVTLAVVGGIALIIDYVFEFSRAHKAGPGLSRISTAVVSICGAIFGLSMTFLANSVWNTEDQARETVNAEARSIRVINIYLGSLTEASREGISRMLTDYGTAVAAEWDDMAEGSTGSAAEHALRDIYAAVVRGFAEGEQNRMLQQRLLGELDSMSTARQQRLSIAENYVSISQWVLVTGLGMVLLFMTAAVHAENPLARRVSLGGLSVAISIMLFVIILHDRPFIGPAAMTPEPILRATGAAP